MTNYEEFLMNCHFGFCRSVFVLVKEFTIFFSKCDDKILVEQKAICLKFHNFEFSKLFTSKTLNLQNF